MIEKSKETYYEMLQKSSDLWHEGENGYLPFLKYYLRLLKEGYIVRIGTDKNTAYIRNMISNQTNKYLFYC